ncbi:efflux RND transporter periplasmic adaptor subunit [Heliobacterium gestii]|uniref:Efflux RND transporter periplasmic adaptor subunit n=1 Tax=Heliomicrobium gestii TaxID=2699 RepID=A0A845LEJ5_HELGE|nr:efflux RND transporter periplasmic adaptor subunit [Heliomicrobium gestii]MBM7867848.1 multidrug efflux pump subunit AcrA (membrane-fusion protein) [Heliomicrobium gestii]MZP43340.1 efflux RND transporter periplasmic adaptor subunit [Heliomicrobium gestii]
MPNLQQRKRTMVKGIAFGCIVATAITLTGCSGGAAPDGKVHKVVVETVGDQGLNKARVVAGRVMGDTESAIMSKLNAKVVQVLVDVGQEVKVGQPLIQLDDRELRVALAQAEANLRAAKARLADTENGARPQERQQMEQRITAGAASLDIAKKTMERTQSLFDAGAASKNQLEAAQLSLTQAQTGYDQLLQQQSQMLEGATVQTLENLRATVAQMSALVDQARLNLEATVITSPVNGRVASKTIHEGEMAATAPAANILLTLVSSEPVVEASVPEEFIKQIAVDQTMKVRIEQVSSEAFDAKVIAVSPMANSASKEYPVKLSLPQSGLWKSGMYAEITLPAAENKAPIVVPKDAVVKRGSERVIMVTDGSTVTSRPVTTGRSDGSSMEIVSGLKGGEKIITVGQNELKDGDAIQVVAERGAAK